MKKTIMMLLCGLVFSLSANAQYRYRPPFGQDKIYFATALSGVDLRYNGSEKWNIDLMGKAGYLFEDNWMLLGQAGYDFRQKGNNAFTAGAGLRYYIEQNGLYLGAGANYVHKHKYDDFLHSVQLGYAFFLIRTVTIEPEIYYNQSLKSHSDYSGFGLRLGFGIYLE